MFIQRAGRYLNIPLNIVGSVLSVCMFVYVSLSVCTYELSVCLLVLFFTVSSSVCTFVVSVCLCCLFMCPCLFVLSCCLFVCLCFVHGNYYFYCQQYGVVCMYYYIIDSYVCKAQLVVFFLTHTCRINRLELVAKV